MAATESTMLALGTKAPPFSLPDTNGKRVTLESFADKPALLVAFVCNHCPFVKHVRTELARLGRDIVEQGGAMVAINSNDVTTHPDDAPSRMVEEVRAAGYTFPYLFDESQTVAKAYRAACTPDFYLFDRDRMLVYRGQLDDSRPSNGKPVTGKDVRAALADVLAGRPVSREQTPSIGCNIKWRPGNAPDYFG